MYHVLLSLLHLVRYCNGIITKWKNYVTLCKVLYRKGVYLCKRITNKLFF